MKVEPSSGEGPSAAAGPSVEEVSTAFGLAPAAPKPAEAVEGGEVGAIPFRPSVMNHGRRTERLITQINLPEFQEELRQLGASAFFREAFVGHIQSVNSLVAIREVIDQGEAILHQAQRKAAEARDRAERAEEALEAARTDRAAELNEAISRATAEAERTRAALDQLGAAMGAVTTRDYRIDALSIEVKEANERVENAEEVARMADARTTEREAMVRRAEAAIAAAEERATAAERRAAKAMDDFRKSTSFAGELAEAFVDIYLQGFWDGKEKVAKVFGLPSIADIKLDEGPEGLSSDDGPAAAEP